MGSAGNRDYLTSDRSTLVELLRDTLAHYYDAAYLQTCELGILVQGANQEQRPLALRQLLRQAIETLKPPVHVPYGQDEWTAYIALWERYIARRSVVAVYQELSMSRSAYYRAERRALEALAELIAPRVEQAHRDASSSASDLDLDRHAIKEAVRIAQSGRPTAVRVSELLRTLGTMLTPLAQSNTVQLCLECPPDLVLQADPNALRQIVIAIVAAICRSEVGGSLSLSVAPVKGGSDWRFEGDALHGYPVERWPAHGEMALSQALLGVLGSRLEASAPGLCPALVFHLQNQSPARVLVVDDDARNQGLYQRYLAERFRLSLASSAQEAWDQIESQLPNLIILDVLMPGEDGWFLLQRLKSDPRTAAIPVIIYSVLLQPNLAISLGASAVLRKPIEEQALLDALQDHL